MPGEHERLKSTLDFVFRPEATTSKGQRELTLLGLLAHGEPITVEALANAQDQPIEDVRQALWASPDIEYDDQGRIIGAGLTLRPTPHQFEIDGQTLYTWCAMDTLIYPRMLGRSARVTSPCHSTGTPIHLVISDSAVTSVSPPTVVVSLVSPDDLTSVRSAFCNHVHFFASADAAHPWLDQHPEATILPVADAYELGRDLTGSSCEDTAHDACY